MLVCQAVGAPADSSSPAKAPAGATAGLSSSEETRVRELFVPMADLHVLLEDQPQRVLLSRAEYEELLAKARKTAESKAPRSALWTSGEYVVTVEEQRARLEGTLGLEVLEDGLWAMPLDCGGVGIRQAELDGKPAAIGRAADGRMTLFVQGKGSHELVLRMVAPLTTTAATQTLQFRLPPTPASSMRLTIPGDVEVKSGLEVIRREVDESARLTRFTLLPRAGDVSLVMTLNSHLARTGRVVLSRSVQICEVTGAYEALHATVSLAVLQRAVDECRFALPDGFEVTEVRSPALASWAVATEGPRRVLVARLRQPATDSVVLHLAAMRWPARLTDWTFPRLVPLDVAGQVSVLGLLAEDRLEPRSIQVEGALAIDNDVLEAALPESVLRGGQGLVPLKTVAAYYAPGESFAFSAAFRKPPARLDVTAALLLTLSDAGQTVHGGLALRPRHERLFAVDLAMPRDWQFQRVMGADGKPLPFERYETPEGPARVQIRLPGGLAPGSASRVQFEAARTPADWLGDWKEKPLEFPAFAVLGEARQTGAIAVAVRDDLDVRPETVQGLVPLDEADKRAFQLEGAATPLAYRFEEGPYKAAMTVLRTPPRITARTFSFVRVESGALVGHYEVLYQVDQARTRRLELALPATTPADLTLRGADGVEVKQYTPREAAGQRIWTVQLAEARRGPVRLVVDFQQPVADDAPKALDAPVVRAGGVAYQSGLVAVEGGAELDVTVTTAARRVDVGELVDARYQPGRRLLGAYGFTGEPVPVTLDVARHPAYDLNPAIVRRASLATWLSAQHPEGLAQTEARFELATKALFLEIRLPAGASLWSVWVDDRPVKPQCEGKDESKSLLVSLPPAANRPTRNLQIVYETPTSAVGLTGGVEVAAPKLRLRARRDAEAVEVPLVDLRWDLYVPAGYEVVHSRGTVVTNEIERPLPAAVGVVGALYWLAGGVQPRLLLDMPMGCSASKKSKAKWEPPDAKSPAAPAAESDSAASPYYLRDDVTTGMEAPGAFSRDELKDMPADKLLTLKRPTPAREVAEDPFAPPAAPATAPATAPDATRVVPPPVTAEPAPPAEAKPEEAEKKPESPQPRKALITRYGGVAKAAKQAQGFRSLPIHLARVGKPVAFQSLGVEPVLEVTLANRDRLTTLGWGLAGAVGLVGLALTRRPARTKVRYVLAVAVIASAVPMVPGWLLLAEPCNLAFFAAAALVPYYLLAGLVRWVAGRCPVCKALAAGGAVLLAIGLSAGWSVADEPAAATGPITVQIVPPPAPVKVPEDAVIVPYDPNSQTGIQDAQRRLVPYEKYLELWDLAYPDQKRTAAKPPAPFGLAGASYTARLADEESLLVEGTLELEVYQKEPVSIPLGLGGGVLARAELDGQPARLSVAWPEGPDGPQPQPPQVPQSPQPPQQAASNQAPNPPAQPAPPQAVQTVQPPAPRPLVLLHVSGEGRHTLALAVRMKLDRRGGWRVAEGTLPAAPATAVAITVPASGTEVRLAHVADRAAYETKQPDERIETALGPEGALGVEWRPKVAEAEVDQSLTVTSQATLDVREDGLRVAWQLALDFRRGRREAFTLAVPAGYLVKRVEGENVRGWEVSPGEKAQTLKVSLLNPANDAERLTVHLRRFEAPEAFDAPAIEVPEAALHQGRLVIRRSPLLEVQTERTSGLSRTDLPPEAPTAEADLESPLGIRPYQAYQFATTPFSIRLVARPVLARTAAELQTVVKVAEHERSLETRVKLRVDDRPIYRVEILLPGGFELEHVMAPGEFQWALADASEAQGAEKTPEAPKSPEAPQAADAPNAPEGRRRLVVHFGQGQSGDVEVLLRGKLARAGLDEPLALPRLTVLGAARQQGDFAIQADPAIRVRTSDLKDCQSVLLSQLDGWLDAKQRPLTQLALHCLGADYAGVLAFQRRAPDVTCSTITNIRLTERAIEETIFLDFTIRQAGVREVRFVLPAWMADSRVSVPLLRQKIVEPVAKEAGSPVRVTLQLQDAMMDQLRVLVQNDRVLTANARLAPIPAVETGQTTRRYVVIESAGRDEVVVDPARLAGLEPLGRRQKEWQSLRAILGEGITQAYLVAPDAKEPRLEFQTRPREAVQTVGARIGIATTRLLLDAEGAYRGRVEFRLDNRTEQFLPIALPDGSTLWSASVAGEPVKPIKDPNAVDRRHVCLPLVKTAPGDPDYSVIVVYGGKLSPPGTLGAAVKFPLVRTVSLQPEQSQAWLYLPKTHRWFDFGGTMRRAESEADLLAEEVVYQTKKASQYLEAMHSADRFAQARAAYNFQQMQSRSGASLSELGGVAVNKKLQDELAQQQEVFRQAQEQAQQIDTAPQQAERLGNRDRLGDLYEEQSAARASNVVQDLGTNWDFDSSKPLTPPASESKKQRGEQNRRWLDSSSLANPALAASGEKDAKTDAGGGQRKFVRKSEAAADAPAKPSAADLFAPQGRPGMVANQPPAEGQPVANAPAQQASPLVDEAGATVERYKSQLRQQARMAQPGQSAYQTFGRAVEGDSSRSDEGRGRVTLGVGVQSEAGLTDAVRGGEPGMGMGPMGGPGLMGPGGGMGPMGPGGGPAQGPQPVQPNLSLAVTQSQKVATAPAAPVAPAGLASLLVDLPTPDPASYQVFWFTTPRGEIEISARSVDAQWLTGAGHLAIVAVLALVAIALVGRVARPLGRWLASPAGSTLLVVVGVLALFSCVFPVAGVVLLVCGVGLKIYRRRVPLAACQPVQS